MSPLESALRASLSTDAVSSDVAGFAVEGQTPSFVVTPASVEEVQAVLVAAHATGAAVIPRGGGSQMHLGAAPERYDIALDLRRLNRVIEYEPADLTVMVEAGIAFDELQHVLGAHGQWLALDPPHDAGATIGGILATNASGPARHRYGAARDLVIGMHVVTAEGEAVKSGGRVVKNVAGYDLAKLHIGALGSLGVIVQATFKVAPLPATTFTATAEGALSILMSITSRLESARLSTQAAVLRRDAGTEWRLESVFAGGTDAVERSRSEFAAIAGANLVAEPADAGRGNLRLDSPVLCRCVVLPSAAARICEGLAAKDAAVVAYPTVGIVYGAWQTDPGLESLRELRRLCVDTGRGALVLERAPAELKRAFDVWGTPRTDFSLMRRLKAELDPKRTLNPGRFVGGL